MIDFLYPFLYCAEEIIYPLCGVLVTVAFLRGLLYYLVK